MVAEDDIGEMVSEAYRRQVALGGDVLSLTGAVDDMERMVRRLVDRLEATYPSWTG